MSNILLKFAIIGVGLIVGIFYAFALVNYPTTSPESTPVVVEQPQQEQQPIQTQDETINLQKDGAVSVKLPADENSTISTEIKGAGGIAGIGKPSVVNITSGNSSD